MKAAPGDNVAAIVKDNARRIRERKKKAESSGLASLEAYRDIGSILRDTKTILAPYRGEFGRWATEEFGFEKQWRSLLMRLSENWDDFLKAKQQAEAEGRVLTKEYSVEGALRFIESWRRARVSGHADRQSRRASSKTAREKEDTSNSGAGGASAPDGEAEVNRLRQQVRDLEEQLAHRRSRPTIDRDTRERAQKVGELWRRGGTPGECAAALERLREIADRLDIGFPSFLRACRISRPEDQPLSRAA